MAEVTREMILDYMQAKGGVVKNVDLVRYFRKFLQDSDPRAKGQARETFKARVNEVAYIKVDDKGDKYLYLKADLGQTSTGTAVHSNRDSTHSILSKRDSTHSVFSKRDSAHSILSYNSPGHSYGQKDSAQQVSGHTSPRTSVNSRTSPRDSPGHNTNSLRSSVQPNLNSYSSGQPRSSLGQSTSAAGHSSGQSSKPPSTASEAPPPTSTTTSSLLGDSLLSDSAFSSFLSGGSALGAATSSGTGSSTGGGAGGGDSSFASDIFGSIGGFWSDSGTTSATVTSSGDQKQQPPSTTAPSALSSSHRSATQQTSSSSKGVKSEVAGSGSVTLQAYKPITSPNPPPSSSTHNAAAPLSRSTRSPSPPTPSRSTHPSSPTPASHKPPSPPRRNLSYTTTYSSGTSSGSVFSPPPQTSSASDGDLLAQMTNQLSSFGDIGSLLDSFGDFSVDKPTASTTLTSSPSDHTSKTTSTPNSSDQSSKLTSSSNSSDQSSVTVVAGRETGSATEPKHVSPSQLQSRGSPAKSSAMTASTFTSIHSHPAPPTSLPAPGSPMRVPRRIAGPPVEPPPPPQSTLTQRRGSLDSSPHIHVQRVESSSSSNGILSPPHAPSGSNDLGTLRGRLGSCGLPPLPPSAMLGSADTRNRLTVATANGGLGVALRQHDRSARDRAQNSVRRSRNLERNTNLDSLTRASIMMTPPSVRRSMQAPGAGGAMYARPAPGSGEDLSHDQYQGEGGDQDGSLSAPSEEYEIDPLEREWMLACASADMQAINTLLIKDSTLINRKDFLHGYTALHWAAKLGRCDFMTALVVNGAFPNIKSNGGFTPLHLACQSGYDNAIAMLVRDHGANVNARDNSGRKPINMLNYSCSDSIRALLTTRLTGSRSVHQSPEHLPSFSQPRARLGSLTSVWASMPNVLEGSDEKQKKRSSPKMNKRTFSFRSRHKVHSPDKKDRPRSHIPETYDA